METMNTQSIENAEKVIKNSGECGVKRLRNSNLELLRIFAMLAIIAHHFVVNSTVNLQYNYLNPTTNQYFLEIWGMWGKTAINSFILISGYFLCKQALTWQRYVKLLAQIVFYNIVIYFIFIATGYEPLTLKGVYKSLLGLLSYINHGFTASFMVFYAFVPIYNIVINNISQKQFRLFIIGIISAMTIAQTFFFSPTMNEPVWYMSLYFIAAYIRIYPNRYTESLKFSTILFLFSTLLAVASVVCIMFLADYRQLEFIGSNRYFMGSESKKILAFIVGLSAFLVAKNVRPFASKFINTVAAGTFGVLLIHANSDTMRQWLWQDVCQVPKLFQGELPNLIFVAVIVPISVFAICSFIDYWRRRWIEKPFMRWINSL